jgi:hypothetical protein
VVSRNDGKGRGELTRKDEFRQNWQNEKEARKQGLDNSGFSPSPGRSRGGLNQSTGSLNTSNSLIDSKSDISNRFAGRYKNKISPKRTGKDSDSKNDSLLSKDLSFDKEGKDGLNNRFLDKFKKKVQKDKQKKQIEPRPESPWVMPELILPVVDAAKAPSPSRRNESSGNIFGLDDKE